MIPFPHWKVRSLCGNLDQVAQRMPVIRGPRISWGRCMMYATRWMITELIQRERMPPEDLRDWKFARIKIAGALEKVSRRHNAKWRRAAELCALGIRDHASEARTRRIGLFRFRAYFETSRLQAFGSHTHTQKVRSTSWDQNLRRNRKALSGSRTIRQFQEWHLAFTRASRDGMRTPASWDIRIRNNE